MKKPKMVLFDYGQTLVNEAKFDGVKCFLSFNGIFESRINCLFSSYLKMSGLISF